MAIMSQKQTGLIVKQLLDRMASGADPDTIGELFSAGTRFEIPGDVGALPWIGRKTGRIAAADFFRDVRRLAETAAREGQLLRRCSSLRCAVEILDGRTDGAQIRSKILSARINHSIIAMI